MLVPSGFNFFVRELPISCLCAHLQVYVLVKEFYYLQIPLEPNMRVSSTISQLSLIAFICLFKLLVLTELFIFYLKLVYLVLKNVIFCTSSFNRRSYFLSITFCIRIRQFFNANFCQFQVIF